MLTVLIKNPNFLILDEPTNDLDLLTLNILEDFLLSYKGCLLVVSHDRYFMDKLINHLLIFEGDGNIRDYNGRYSEYRMEMEEKEKTDTKEKNLRLAANREEIVNRSQVKKKFSFKEKLEYEKLEKEISALEEERAVLTEKLSSGNGDHVQVNEWALRMQQIIGEVDVKSMRWLELSELGI